MEAPVQTDERVPPRGFQKAVHPPSRWIEEGTGREEGWEEEGRGGMPPFPTFSDLFTDETDVNLAPRSPLCHRERKGY